EVGRGARCVGLRPRHARRVRCDITATFGDGAGADADGSVRECGTPDRARSVRGDLAQRSGAREEGHHLVRVRERQGDGADEGPENDSAHEEGLSVLMVRRATLEAPDFFEEERTLVYARSPSRVATRILVVDDSPTIRKVVSAILERHGYEAVGAADGQAALD